MACMIRSVDARSPEADSDKLGFVQLKSVDSRTNLDWETPKLPIC